MPLTSRQVGRSASEKVNIHLAGTVDGFEVVTETVFAPKLFVCSTARILTIFHSLQAGLCALLYWEHDSGEHELIMPIEGRGLLAFDRFDGMQNPRTDGLTGTLLMRVYQMVNGPEPDSNIRHFALSFELYKQRS